MEINIRALIRHDTKGQTSSPRIVMNKTFGNKSDIAEQLFNKYFVSVGPSLASIIDHCDEEPT